MSEWKEVRLGDFALVKGGKRLPKGKILTTKKNSHPYIRIRDLGQEKVLEINDTYEYVDDETQQAISRYIVSTNDILISIVGTIGLVAIVGKSLDNANLTENCVKLVNIEDVDKEYLYYFLVSKSGQDAIKNEVVGAVQQKLPIKNIQNIKVPLPPLTEQHRIASILSSLDSKIENNRKICANLEAQAQALFKHWFIDFAPFKDGKFVESELGMIPEGWRVGRLGEIADINPSRTIQKGEKATYLDMKNMPTIGSVPLSWEVKEYNGGMKFMNGDTLMARITPCLENGKIAYVNFLQNKEIAFGSTEYIVLSPKNNLFSEYLYFLCRYSSFINYAVKNMNGSSGRQRVSGDTISNYDMIIAPKEIYKEVEPIFKDIMSHIKSLGQESILLSSLRDTLLPKLMSGEIKV